MNTTVIVNDANKSCSLVNSTEMLFITIFPYDPCKLSVEFFIKKYQGISNGFEIQPLPKRFYSPFLQN